MSPRRRRVDDQAVIAAAAKVVAERGATRTRLSDVAVEIGLAPATLLQRFGSREALLQAVAGLYSARISSIFFAVPAQSSHLERLEAALHDLAASGDLPFLINSGFAELTTTYSLELRKQIAYSLSVAIQAGEVSHCDVAAFARRIQTLYYGLAFGAVLEGETMAASDIGAAIRDTLAGHV